MNDYDLRAYRLLRKMKLAQIAKASLIIKDSGIKGLNNKINSRRQWKKNSNVDTRVFENIEFKINSIDIKDVGDLVKAGILPQDLVDRNWLNYEKSL